MSVQYTTKKAFGYPEYRDPRPDLSINQTILDLDRVNAITDGVATVPAAQRPVSTSLHVQVANCTYRKADGTIGTYAGTASQAVSASAATYLWLTDGGTLTAGSAWPAANVVRLAIVTADADSVTDIEDARVALLSAGLTGGGYLLLTGGTLDDSGGVVTINLGTTNGTKLGGATSQKLAFYNATPVVQPAHADQGAVTATSTALTDSTGGTASSTLADVTSSFDEAILNNNFASLAARYNEAVTELAQLKTLVNRLRTDLGTLGLIKGSA